MQNQARKITFLGTGAADCPKDIMTRLADRFDRNERRMSSALLGDSLMIDCGPHALQAREIAGISQPVSDLFLTHLHGDHFNADAVRKLKPARIWVREDAVLPEFDAEIIRMKPKEEYPVEEGVTVTGLIANHDPNAFPQQLLFNLHGKKLLYALDGAWFMTETWNFLKGANVDLLVLDATVGDYAGDYRLAEHNSIPMIRLMLPSLLTWKITTEHTSIILSHIARTLHKSHDETAKIAEEMGVTAAFDGMVAEF